MKKASCLGWLKHEAKRFSMTPITFLPWRVVTPSTESTAVAGLPTVPLRSRVKL
jgi:hypothetical protein